jgi:uncharacterized damage-inducible protein DinB
MPDNAAYLRRLVDYGSWANRGLLDFLAGLPTDALDATTPGVFGSVRDTFRHLLTSEMAYRHRLLGLEPYDESDVPERPDLADLRRLADESATALPDLVDRLPEADVMRTTGSGQRAAGTILTQLFLHGVEHRTHINTILGVTGLLGQGEQDPGRPEPPDQDAWVHGIFVHDDDWPEDWGPEPAGRRTAGR